MRLFFSDFSQGQVTSTDSDLAEHAPVTASFSGASQDETLETDDEHVESQDVQVWFTTVIFF